jgi:hypothetical protein
MLIDRLCTLLWLLVVALAVAVAAAVAVSVVATAVMLLLLLCTSGRAGSSVTCLALTARGDDGGDCTAPVTVKTAVVAVAAVAAAVGVAVSDAICGGGMPVQ